MTPKSLFWMLIGPAAWTLILLIVSSGKAEVFVDLHDLEQPASSVQMAVHTHSTPVSHEATSPR